MAWIAIRTNQRPNFTEAQKQNNVNIIASYFRARGWTDNAIAALCGNMEIESYLNPAQSELGSGLYDTSYGFGLVQWTGASRIDFVSWAGVDWETDYNKQLERIIYEMNGGYVQWIPVAAYGYMSFVQFSQSTATPEYLAMAFEYSYERGTPLQADREAAARKWYNYLIETPTPSLGIPIWLLFKIRWNGGLTT